MSTITATHVAPRRSDACTRPDEPTAVPDGLHPVRTRTLIATGAVIAALSIVAVALYLAGSSELSLLACGGILGWLNLSGGPCAQNALTAITPLAGGPSHNTWYTATFAYTVAGLASSASIGVVLGTLGLLAGFSEVSATAGVIIVASLAVYTLLREGLGIQLPLLQAKRSSRMAFARLGQPTAAVLWGLDVGSFFSTWLTYAGAWWLVAIGVCSGNVWFAAALFGAHWLGRSALVWLGRWMIPDPNEGHRLPAVWTSLHPAFRRAYATIVVGATAAIILVF